MTISGPIPLRPGIAGLELFTLQCHINHMNQIKTVCVYCGSGSESSPSFVEAVIALGKIFAGNQIRLVYGGESAGLMGAVAKSVLDHGGSVTGIIPEFLRAKENALARVQEMVITPDMHERKRLMFERSDAFVALPGGIGTLEELVEQMTWAQLGRHRKPILILNISQFWDPLCALLEHMQRLAFVSSFSLLVAETPEEILPKLRAAAAKVSEKEKQGARETVERL